MATRLTNEQLLSTGKTTAAWLKLGKNERKLLLRAEQNDLCHFCGSPLPGDPSLFDIARTPGHPYSKADYRDKTICYVGHAAMASGCPANGHQGADHGNVPWFSQLAAVVQAREEVQRMRIRLGNRRLATERGMDDPSLIPGVVAGLDARIAKIEDDLTGEMGSLMREARPIALAAVQVLGVGPTTIARILAEIDIRKAPSRSSLHKFAGYAPGFDRMVKGELEDGKRKRGEKRPYNARLRVACFNQGEALLIQGISRIKKSAWPAAKPDERTEQWQALSWQERFGLAKRFGAELYACDYLERRAATDGDEKWASEEHRNMDAIRRMMKLWLSHLWEVWRGLEGLETPPPYPMTAMGGGHSGYIAPSERGWAETN
jgi:hypothetical protein